MRVRLGVCLLVALGSAMAGCGSGKPAPAPGSAGRSFNSAAVVSSASCSVTGSKAGQVAHPCVFVLGDGSRFRCPPSFAHAVQSAASLERAKACHRLSPLTVPAAWRPGLAALQRAGTCLLRRGLRVLGGPNFEGIHSAEKTPIGELIIQNGQTPIFVGYYPSAGVARQFEATAATSVRRSHGQVVRGGAVLVIFTRPPASDRRATVEGCTFG